ncbi:MAG: extracellular solute-binding protein, partial [Chloroflexota bacterium]
LQVPPNRWDAKGWTYDDFRVAAEQLTQQQGDQPPSVYGFVNPTRSYFPWVYANGGRLINAENSAGMLDRPEAIGAFQFIRDLMHKHRVSPLPAEFKDTEPIKTFLAGRSAMLVSAAATASTQLRAITGFEWDAAPMPAGPGMKAGARGTHGGGSGWVLAKAGRYPEEAWALMQHITSKETVTDLARAGWSPPRLSVLDSALWLDPATPPKAKAVLRDAYKAIVTNPQILTWDAFITAANQTLNQLWADKITATEAGQTIAQVTRPAIDEHNRQVQQGIPSR